MRTLQIKVLFLLYAFIVTKEIILLLLEGDMYSLISLKRYLRKLHISFTLGGDIVKEKIQEKLQKNIERILEKDELLPSDVAILEEKLKSIKLEEERPLQEEKMKQLLENSFFNQTSGE